MSTFREFEHAGWEDPRTCAAYRDHLGPVVAQVVGPLLDAVDVRTADRVVDVATGADRRGGGRTPRCVGDRSGLLDRAAPPGPRGPPGDRRRVCGRRRAAARLVERRCRRQQLRHTALPGSRGVPAGVRAGATPGGAPGVHGVGAPGPVTHLRGRLRGVGTARQDERGPPTRSGPLPPPRKTGPESASASATYSCRRAPWTRRSPSTGIRRTRAQTRRSGGSAPFFDCRAISTERSRRCRRGFPSCTSRLSRTRAIQ